MNKSIEDVPQLNIIQTIQTKHDRGITSICILKDKRLASSSYDKSIIIYNKSYQLQLHIKTAHDDSIWSLCVLVNGDLVSSSEDSTIKIWKINENDYQLIHTLKGHNGSVYKVIEMKDGKLCSSSKDTTIKIWNNAYQCITTLVGHTEIVYSVLEINDFIISASYDYTLRVWDKSSYEFIRAVKGVSCSSPNGLLKLNNKAVLLGGYNELYIVDFEIYKVKKIKDCSLGWIQCFNALGNGFVIFGNDKGEICYYNSLSNQIILKQKFHNANIYCFIGTDDNKLISCSFDHTINIYKEI